jgi:hypothetical protein
MNCWSHRILPVVFTVVIFLLNPLSADVFVSDFENGTAENDIGTNWFFFNDATDGGISEINNSSDNETFAGGYGPGYDGSSYAGVMDFDIYYGDYQYPYVAMGFNFNSTNTAVNMTGATAITFNIRANKQMTIKMHFKQSSIADGNYYGHIIDVGTSWTTVTIPTATGTGGLVQEPWGDAAPFEIDKLVGLEWLFRHQGDNPERDQDGILYIDNVEFLGDPIGLSGTPADSLMLGDFENGSATTDVGTYWFFFDDSGSGGASTIDNAGPYGKFIGEYAPGCNSDYAGRMDYTIVYDEIDFPHVGMGMYLTNYQLPTDLSGITAIRFDIRASYAMDIKFHVIQSTVLDYNFHYTMVDAGTSWQTITVPLNSGFLEQESWGDEVPFDITCITGFQWLFRHNEDNEGSPLSGSLFIDNVRLIGTPTGLQPPYPPIPIDPVWHATGVPTSPTMNWYEIDEAVSYSLQVSENENMSSPVVDESGITDTFFTVAGLTSHTVYYWRINATDGTTTSGWAPPTIFTTAYDVPPPPVLSAPSDEATAVTRTPELSWGAATGADSYALQLSVESDFSNLTVDETELTATSFTSPELDDNTTCYWRVNATNATGTSDWSTSFSFTTREESPAVPVPTSPTDDAEDVAVDVSLLWNTADRAETYTVQVATSSAFSTFIVNQSDISATVYSDLSLENGTGYFWRVRGTNEGGDGEWSAVFSFTTIVAAPGSPQLVAPADIADLVPVEATLKWHEIENAVSYSVLVATNDEFDDPVIDSDEIDDTTVSTDALENFTKYYWKVQAVNAGGEGEWSSVRSFRTIVALPEAVRLVSLEDEDSIEISESVLVWQTGTPMIERYCIEIATDESMEDAATDTVTDTSLTISELTENTRYWWRVRACNVAGWGPFSGKRSFFVREKNIGIITPKEFKVLTFSANKYGGMFRFALPKRADVAIDLYSLNGRLVCRMLNSVHDAGIHTLQFPHLTNGTYFMKFTAGEYRYNHKLIVSR